jgi:hypothetical protein
MVGFELICRVFREEFLARYRRPDCPGRRSNRPSPVW